MELNKLYKSLLAAVQLVDGSLKSIEGTLDGADQ